MLLDAEGVDAVDGGEQGDHGPQREQKTEAPEPAGIAFLDQICRKKKLIALKKKEKITL